jgi:hypothetical protein
MDGVLLENGHLIDSFEETKTADFDHRIVKTCMGIL